MRITSIEIRNFRAIKYAKLESLGNAIVIAGPNGCGKSSIFDAIRLLKSAYGQYSQNEYASWLNEFQINAQQSPEEFSKIFYDKTKPLTIEVIFELTDKEKLFLQEGARQLSEQLQLSRVIIQQPTPMVQSTISPVIHAAQAALVKQQVDEFSRNLVDALAKRKHTARLSIHPKNNPIVEPNAVIEMIFNAYRPNHIGIIDYYAASRVYGREQIGGINLQLQNKAQRDSQHVLYNTQNKYQGVKTEMAQSFIRQLVLEKAGNSAEKDTLKATLDELFSVFFPGKSFLGARPHANGGLEFPVKLADGSEHDIDELSSGEKEVLLGYLRLRNNAPKNSVLLIDEPELHLNPRLVRGLPRFYEKHIGQALENQLWLITHSDTLLRESVDEPAYAVFHMQPAATVAERENQLVSVVASAGVERVIVDLVGDLATYSPRSKVVIVEGEESEFDASVIRELFPDFAERVNLVSAGSRKRVEALYKLLRQASERRKIDARFFSIADRDATDQTTDSDGGLYLWNVYHIENYLLNVKYIRQAIQSLVIGDAAMEEEEIMESLRKCAVETLDGLVRMRMEQLVNHAMVQCISTRIDPNANLAPSFAESALQSLARLKVKVENDLDAQKCVDMEASVKEPLMAALRDGRWLQEFRGRDILRRFVGVHSQSLKVPYEQFRNIIINRMREGRFRPPGMAHIFRNIQNSN